MDIDEPVMSQPPEEDGAAAEAPAEAPAAAASEGDSAPSGGEAGGAEADGEGAKAGGDEDAPPPEGEYEVEKVSPRPPPPDYSDITTLKHRMLTGMPQVLAKRTRKGVLQYKVRWKNYGEEADTWEPLDNLDNAVDQIKAYHDDKEAEKEAKKSACNPSPVQNPD